MAGGFSARVATVQRGDCMNRSRDPNSSLGLSHAGGMKVLIAAEHASARFGGEALIPLQYFRFLRKLDVDVRLLVHERTRAELDELLAQDAERIHYVGDSKINLWCNWLSQFLPQRVADFTVAAVSHLNTQLRQQRDARQLIERFGIDIVHEPIPVSPKMPSLMYDLGVPVVIGPMNGGMNYPVNYVENRWEQRLVELMRGFAGLLNRIMPGKYRASLLLIANDRTRTALPRSLQAKKMLHLCENGVDLDTFSRGRWHAGRNAKSRIVFIGRLVRVKRIDLLLDACAALSKDVPFVLDVIGDGPLRGELEYQAKCLSISESVVFRGLLTQEAIAETLAEADMLIMPSMRECGGAVVLEAMAMSVPVIAAAWGGPLDYLDDECGVLLEPTYPEAFVQSLADSITKLAGDRALRESLGSAARRKVERDFDWIVKARRVLTIYGEVVQAGARHNQ
jgi:glycosyltransferase involved in cell wall biosynthesis